MRHNIVFAIKLYTAAALIGAVLTIVAERLGYQLFSP